MKSKIIIGLWSGTSVDGFDIMFCKIESSSRDTKISILLFKTEEYKNDYKAALQSV